VQEFWEFVQAAYCWVEELLDVRQERELQQVWPVNEFVEAQVLRVQGQERLEQ